MTTRLQNQERLKTLGADLDRELRNLDSLQINGYMGDRGYEGLYMTKCNMLVSALMAQTEIVEVLLKTLNLSPDPLWVNRIERIKSIHHRTLFGTPRLKQAGRSGIQQHG